MIEHAVVIAGGGPTGLMIRPDGYVAWVGDHIRVCSMTR